MLTAEQRKLVEDNLPLADYFVRTQPFIRPLRHRLRCQWSDMFSIAHIALCYAAERFNPDNGGLFSVYFYKVCRGLFLNELRTTKNHRNSVMYNSMSYDMPVGKKEEQYARDLFADPRGGYEECVALLQLINSCLSDRERRYISLHCIEGYSIAEISALFNTSYKAVSVTMSRARSKLRQYL